MLDTGAKMMGRQVEIEFAGVLPSAGNNAGGKGRLYWLQIRPMVDRSEMPQHQLFDVDDANILIRSTTALGHGITDNIRGVVLVKQNSFSFENNFKIASAIEKINSNFTGWNENYILAGPGRWGSSDPALGIPVKWTDIAAARLIVEVSMPGKRIEPSQGTHFFQNLTSNGVGYFTVGNPGDGSIIDVDYIMACPAVLDTPLVRVVRFEQPLQVAIDGIKGVGIVLKPDGGSHHNKSVNNK